jgi:hypothetical protein
MYKGKLICRLWLGSLSKTKITGPPIATARKAASINKNLFRAEFFVNLVINNNGIIREIQRIVVGLEE